MKTAKVTFKSTLDGKFTMHVEGLPGEQCLNINSKVEDLLSNIGITLGETEATEEMYVNVSKDPEAFNNV